MIKILKPVKKKKIRREIKILQVGLVMQLTAHIGRPIVPKRTWGRAQHGPAVDSAHGVLWSAYSNKQP